jgi:hypothetical protein
MEVINKVSDYNFSNKHFKTSLVKNVRKYQINKSSIVINLDMEDISIHPTSSENTNTIRKLPRWQSATFSNVTIIEAIAVLIIEDNSLNVPDFSNENISDFPLVEVNTFEKNQLKRNDIRNEIIEGEWEHVSKQYPDLKNMYLWKTPESRIKIIDGFKFDPYYVAGLSNNYDSSKEIEFVLKNYIWFATGKTHCGIHNQHPFIEFHTQLSGFGRMVKFNSQKTTDYYEDQRLSAGESQSHTYSTIDEIDIQHNKIQFSYPWHEYYSDSDCIWLVSEFWPVGNLKD